MSVWRLTTEIFSSGLTSFTPTRTRNLCWILIFVENRGKILNLKCDIRKGYCFMNAFCVGLYYLKSRLKRHFLQIHPQNKTHYFRYFNCVDPSKRSYLYFFILPLVGSLKTTSISGSCSVRTQEPAPDVSCQSRCQTAWGPTYTIYIVQPSRPATSRAANKGSRRFINYGEGPCRGLLLVESAY